MVSWATYWFWSIQVGPVILFTSLRVNGILMFILPHREGNDHSPRGWSHNYMSNFSNECLHGENRNYKLKTYQVFILFVQKNCSRHKGLGQRDSKHKLQGWKINPKIHVYHWERLHHRTYHASLWCLKFPSTGIKRCSSVALGLDDKGCSPHTEPSFLYCFSTSWRAGHLQHILAGRLTVKSAFLCLSATASQSS